MSKGLDRRDAAKTVAAAGGLLLLTGLGSAARADEAGTLSGEWFNSGKLDQPCAIFQQGRVLLLINEKGDVAVAHLTEASGFTVIKGWEEGVAGRIDERGKVIAWKSGGHWKRR
jgi:hypothetical protein